MGYMNLLNRARHRRSTFAPSELPPGKKPPGTTTLPPPGNAPKLPGPPKWPDTGSPKADRNLINRFKSYQKQIEALQEAFDLDNADPVAIPEALLEIAIQLSPVGRMQDARNLAESIATVIIPPGEPTPAHFDLEGTGFYVACVNRRPAPPGFGIYRYAFKTGGADFSDALCKSGFVDGPPVGQVYEYGMDWPPGNEGANGFLIWQQQNTSGTRGSIDEAYWRTNAHRGKPLPRWVPEFAPEPRPMVLPVPQLHPRYPPMGRLDLAPHGNPPKPVIRLEADTNGNIRRTYTDTHVRQPPGKHVKERKRRLNGAAAQIIGAVTEGQELIVAAHDALPRKYQTRSKNILDIGEAVYENLDKLDILQFIGNVAANAVEDQALGRISKQNKKLLEEYKWLTGTGVVRPGPSHNEALRDFLGFEKEDQQKDE